jgi:hypothetical protein
MKEEYYKYCIKSNYGSVYTINTDLFHALKKVSKYIEIEHFELAPYLILVSDTLLDTNKEVINE